MVTTNNDTTQKTYKKLSIQVSLNGLSFLIYNTLDSKVEKIKHFWFVKNEPLEEEISAVLSTELLKEYMLFDSVNVLHTNALNTFVPKAMYKPELHNEYLKNSIKTFPSDIFSVDELPNYDCMNVYVPYMNINNILIEKLGSFTYKNSSTILVSKLLDVSKNNENKQVFIHFHDKNFEIIVVQNQKLLLFNSFEYENEHDFVYYLLFTLEQLQVNPEKIEVICLGNITEEDVIFKSGFTFVRNFSLFDASVLAENTCISTEIARKNFVLLNV